MNEIETENSDTTKEKGNVCNEEIDNLDIHGKSYVYIHNKSHYGSFLSVQFSTVKFTLLSFTIL